MRPRPSFGGAAPPRAALRCALPLGPLGTVVGAPPPPCPPPPVGAGGAAIKHHPSISADETARRLRRFLPVLCGGRAWFMRSGLSASRILDKDKAGALVTLLLLSVPAPARSIRFCRTSPSKAGNSWRRSWSPPYRCDSGGAAHAHNCPQSAPTGPRRIFSSANGHPRSGAF